MNALPRSVLEVLRSAPGLGVPVETFAPVALLRDRHGTVHAQSEGRCEDHPPARWWQGRSRREAVTPGEALEQLCATCVRPHDLADDDQETLEGIEVTLDVRDSTTRLVGRLEVRDDPVALVGALEDLRSTTQLARWARRQLPGRSLATHLDEVLTHAAEAESSAARAARSPEQRAQVLALVADEATGTPANGDVLVLVTRERWGAEPGLAGTVMTAYAAPSPTLQVRVLRCPETVAEWLRESRTLGEDAQVVILPPGAAWETVETTTGLYDPDGAGALRELRAAAEAAMRV